MGFRVIEWLVVLRVIFCDVALGEGGFKKEKRKKKKGSSHRERQGNGGSLCYWRGLSFHTDLGTVYHNISLEFQKKKRMENFLYNRHVSKNIKHRHHKTPSKPP